MSLVNALQISLNDLETMADMSSGFKSMLVGTAAEMQLVRLFSANAANSNFVKNPDLQRSKRSDFTVEYKGYSFRVELKTEGKNGKVILKTSDKATYTDYTDGETTFSTTAMPADRFDILAVSLFNRGHGWGFAFVEVDSLARTEHEAVPERLRADFLSSNVDVSAHDEATTDPFTLFDRIIDRNNRFMRMVA